jgi:hypothetical protein
LQTRGFTGTKDFQYLLLTTSSHKCVHGFTQQGRQTQHQQHETTGETTGGERQRRRRGRDNPDEDREEEPKEKREADQKEKKKGFEKKTISVCIQKKKQKPDSNHIYGRAQRESHGNRDRTRKCEGNVKKMCSEESRALGMQRAARTEERG